MKLIPVQRCQKLNSFKGIMEDAEHYSISIFNFSSFSKDLEKNRKVIFDVLRIRLSGMRKFLK